MNFGEMKTTVFSKIPKEKREDVSVFEFGEAIDAAQRLFAAILPSGSVPEILIENFVDRSDDLGAEKIIPLPEDYLRIETVHFAQARDADTDEPLRVQARIISPSEFEELEGSGSTDYIASVFNNLLHLHPTPVAAATGAPAAIKMVYRKIPRPYMTTAGILQKGARLNLKQNADSRHTFEVYDFSAEEQRDFSYFGLDVNVVAGGYAFIGAPGMNSSTSGPIYVCRIVMAWEQNIGTEMSPVMAGLVRMSSDDAIPFANDTIVPTEGFMFPYCYITERQVFGYSGNAIEAEDWEFPELGVAWHNMVCDYAISRIESSWNPQGAAARENRVFQVLTAAGASLDAFKGAR